MKYCFLWLLLFLMFAAGYPVKGQSRQQLKTDSVFLLFKQFYNNHETDSVYALVGKNYKKEVSPIAFRNIAFHSLYPMGDIRGTLLTAFLNNKVARYTVSFDFASMELMLSLDDDNKIELLLFQPYKAEPALKARPVLTDNKMRTTMDKAADSVARAYIQQGSTAGLSIGIIKNGITHIYNYGETAKGTRQLPDAGSIYEIGSISKTFTATLLAWYVNNGTIALSDPVTKFLPDSVASNKALEGITLQMLSNHTSGLPRLPDNLDLHTKDPLDPYAVYTKSDLFAYLKTCTLNGKPGERYAYSNLAVGLLGVILEKVSGKTYAQMADEIICKPLGMKTTLQHVTAALKLRFVTGYNEDGKVTPPWHFDALAACGSLRSTVSDLLLYTRCNMHPPDGKLGKAMLLTHQPTFSRDVNIGLGWHFITVEGTPYVFHNGGTFGFSSFLAFNSAKDLAVVVLSNCGASTDQTGTALLKKLQ